MTYREFNVETHSFVEDGFSLPLAKSNVNWRDVDALWVGTDFGEGTLTTSGYPRQARLWKRGTPLSDAELVFEIPVELAWLSRVPAADSLVSQSAVTQDSLVR